ncbi:MAG: hypothetical protein WCA76_20940 [Candidatus Sulfotelmatobacter sp.]|jgi:hypothetical protein
MTTNGHALAPERVTWIAGRIVPLTARPGTIEDAALVILLRQRTLCSNDSVTGSEAIDVLCQAA